MNVDIDVADEEEVTIAILDDRAKMRMAVKDGLEGVLPLGWSCLICPLLPEINEYPEWLDRNGVSVLLLDQLLNEQEDDSEGLVNYRGDEVIRVIRARHPDFPIIVVTAVPNNPELNEAFGSADGIIKRSDLLDEPEKHVPRFERLAVAFVRRHRQELARLGELAERAASGDATDTELSELKALQLAMCLSPVMLRTDEALTSLELRLDELRQIEVILKKRLKPKK